MSADMYINIMNEECTEEILEGFFSNTLGSKYFNPKTIAEQGTAWDDAYDIVARTPQIYVGEVSWLKAIVTGDSDTFVPNYIEDTQKICNDDFPVIDDALIEKMSIAYLGPNHSVYSTGSGFDDVFVFLEEHRGKRCFTVSW